MHWRPVRLDWVQRMHGERKRCRRGCTAFLTTNLTTKPGDTLHTLGLRAEIAWTVELAGACRSKPCKVNLFSGRQGVGSSNPPCSTLGSELEISTHKQRVLRIGRHIDP